MKIYLGRRHTPTVGNGAFSHKIDYIVILQEILNPEGHQNRIAGSRVTAIFLRKKSEFFLLVKVVKLVGGGFGINGAYPV